MPNAYASSVRMRIARPVRNSAACCPVSGAAGSSPTTQSNSIRVARWPVHQNAEHEATPDPIAHGFRVKGIVAAIGANGRADRAKCLAVPGFLPRLVVASLASALPFLNAVSSIREAWMSVIGDLPESTTGCGDSTPSDVAKLLANKPTPIEISTLRSLASVYSAFRLQDAIIEFAAQSAGQIAYDRTRSRDYAVAVAQAAAKAIGEQFMM